MTTIKEIRSKIGVYNKTINNYITAFDIHIQKDFYVDAPNYFGDFRDYQTVSIEFANLLYSQNKKMVEFEKDYYKWKTPKEISITTGLDLKRILLHLNSNKRHFIETDLNTHKEKVIDNVTGMRNNKIDDSTKIKNISSYKIMRDIHREERNNAIQNIIT
ncbi:hypothetical protein [Candidatus Venteria ishoeyi]|nr:hypothetical protein [Candidatus Venteria ishoeyi]